MLLLPWVVNLVVFMILDILYIFYNLIEHAVSAFVLACSVSFIKTINYSVSAQMESLHFYSHNVGFFHHLSACEFSRHIYIICISSLNFEIFLRT